MIPPPAPPAATAPRRRAVNVAMIPSVSGGLGHVTRTVKLARALQQADASLRISYVLDEVDLRPLNLEAVERTGYPVHILPNPVRHEREAKIRAVLGETDVVIEDTNRRLIAHRRYLPRLRAWVSIPMLPLWDELFMDWPLLEHVDRILYAYPAVMPIPEELDRFRDKVTVTGPILDTADVPGRAVGRRRLRLPADARYIIYAPRGFPFGRWFGRRVLTGVVGGFMRLRREQPDLHLVLSAVTDVGAIQPPGLPPLDEIEGITLQGVVSPQEAWECLAGADLAVVEGTSTLFDAAVLRTPVLMVPGLIYECALEGTWVDQNGAGVVMRPGEVTPLSMARAFRAALEPAGGATRAARLHQLVGTGGRDQAVAAVLEVIAQNVSAQDVSAQKGMARQGIAREVPA